MHRLPFSLSFGLCWFLFKLSTHVAAAIGEGNESLAEIIEHNLSNTSQFTNDTRVSIEIIEAERAEAEVEVEVEEDVGESDDEDYEPQVCEEPSALDRFLYLFVWTKQCYAYSGSGPEWAAMTGWTFEEDSLRFSPSRRISAIKTGGSQRTNQTESTTIYSCGNGKKLPPFAPVVHILNSSWFLQASTASKTGEEKEKGKKAETEDGQGEEKNETTTAGETNGTAIRDQKERRVQNKSNPDEDWCMLVNFYAASCPFSAKLAPFYNALPRVFPKLLYIAAVDATESSRLNLIYGVAGTPTVMLFHNGKPVARLDEGEYALQTLVSFISQRTDLKPLMNMDIEEEDLQGPLTSVPIRGMDYYLILAWVFIVACAVYYGAQSSTARRLWETLCRNWREMEEEEGAADAGR